VGERDRGRGAGPIDGVVYRSIDKVGLRSRPRSPRVLGLAPGLIRTVHADVVTKAHTIDACPRVTVGRWLAPKLRRTGNSRPAACGNR
jgi:hypothetical protein